MKTPKVKNTTIVLLFICLISSSIVVNGQGREDDNDNYEYDDENHAIEDNGDENTIILTEEEYELYYDSLMQSRKHGGYGSIHVGVTSIDHANSWTIGFKGGIVLFHKVGLGGMMQAVNSQAKQDIYLNNEKYYYTVLYGGIFIEPILLSTKTVSVSLPIMIGGGRIRYQPRSNGGNNTTSNSILIEGQAEYFIGTPGIDVAINANKFFQLGVSAAYQVTSDFNLEYFSTAAINNGATKISNGDALNGAIISFFIKFGYFGGR